MSAPSATEHSLSGLFRQGRRFRHQRGDVILREADGPPAIYFIESGHVKAYTLTDDGEENLLFIFKAGELFPLNILAADNSRVVFHEALTTTMVWRLSVERLNEMMKSDVLLALLVLTHAAEQLNNLLRRIDNLEYSSAYARIVYRMIYLAHRFGKETEEGVLIDIPITQQEIAGSVNLARETASRVIERLERENLINYRAHRLLITDIATLRAKINIDPDDKW